MLSLTKNLVGEDVTPNNMKSTQKKLEENAPRSDMKATQEKLGAVRTGSNKSTRYRRPHLLSQPSDGRSSKDPAGPKP